MKVPFNDEDKIIMKHCRLGKGYGVKRLLSKFANNNRSRVACGTFGQIDSTECVGWVIGSGWPNSATTDEKTEAVEELILNKEKLPGTHKIHRKIAAMLECSQSGHSKSYCTTIT